MQRLNSTQRIVCAEMSHGSLWCAVFDVCRVRGCQYLHRTLHTVYNHTMVEWRRCGESPKSQQDNFNACSNLWIQESSALACSTAYLHTDGQRMDLTTFLNLSDAYYHGQQQNTHLHTSRPIRCLLA